MYKRNILMNPISPNIIATLKRVTKAKYTKNLEEDLTTPIKENLPIKIVAPNPLLMKMK